jgi:hypothetical protein
MFVNKDLTSASYVKLLPLVGPPLSRGIFDYGNIGTELLRPLAVAARVDVQMKANHPQVNYKRVPNRTKETQRVAHVASKTIIKTIIKTLPSIASRNSFSLTIKLQAFAALYQGSNHIAHTAKHCGHVVPKPGRTRDVNITYAEATYIRDID